MKSFIILSFAVFGASAQCLGSGFDMNKYNSESCCGDCGEIQPYVDTSRLRFSRLSNPTATQASDGCVNSFIRPQIPDFGASSGQRFIPNYGPSMMQNLPFAGARPVEIATFHIPSGRFHVGVNEAFPRMMGGIFPRGEPNMGCPPMRGSFGGRFSEGLSGPFCIVSEGYMGNPVGPVGGVMAPGYSRPSAGGLTENNRMTVPGASLLASGVLNSQGLSAGC